MTRPLLAIDQGTSGTKAVIFAPDGTILASATAPLQTRYNANGWAEQNPDAIYSSAIEAVRETVSALEEERGIPRSQVAAIGIANQRETFVIWDRDGVPLSQAIVWQCKRSTGICAELADAEGLVRERSGLIIDPYFSGTKVTWLMRNAPAVRKAHERREAHFGTVDSWLLFRITGGRVHGTDVTNASRTLLFNIHELTWDSELATLLEAKNLVLPEVRPCVHEFGATDFEGVFSSPVPITAMIGDSHSAFFGERCFAPGSAKATLGTGSSILLNAGDEAPPPYPSTMSTIGFALPNRVDYALEGIIVSAGAVLIWLERELDLFSDPDELQSLAETIGSAGGVAFVPGHAGLGAPFWRMDARGSIHGLTFATSKAHIVRAALESIPYQIRAILDAVRDESGTACESIRTDGGMSRNGFVARWLADCLGVPVHTFQIADVTAFGAALLAGIGAGVYTGIEAVARLEIEETILEPRENRDPAESGYARWRGIVDRTWGTHAGG